MLQRLPVPHALLGVVARPAILAFAAAIGVAGLLAAIVLGSSETTDPTRPTPSGTAILAPSDRELGLLQTPTPQPTAVPAESIATEPSEPQLTPTPRVVSAPTAPPRPTSGPPTTVAFEDATEVVAPAADEPAAPTAVPNVQITPSPTAPPAPTADLPAPVVLEPVNVAAEPTRAPRQERPAATEPAETREATRDAPPTPTAIRIVPGGPPGGSSGGAVAAAAPSSAPAIQATNLGDEIRATVTAAQSVAGVSNSQGRNNRPVALPAQTAAPDKPALTVEIPPVDVADIIARANGQQAPLIVPRNPATGNRPTTTARSTVVVPLPPPIVPSANQPPARPQVGGGNNSPFGDDWPFNDKSKNKKQGKGKK